MNDDSGYQEMAGKMAEFSPQQIENPLRVLPAHTEQ